jgi:hypothetical protein
MSTQPEPERHGALLRFVHWMCKHVFLDILSETDSFDMMLRKIVVNSGLAFFVHPTFFFFYNLYASIETGWTVGTSVFMYACIQYDVLWIWCYAYSRIHGTIPDFVVDAWVLVGWCSMTLITFSSTYPSLVPLVAMAMNATIVRTPRMGLSLALMTISFLFGAYNLAAIKTGEEPLWLPGTRSDNFYEHLVNNVSTYLVAAVPLGTVILQSLRNGQMIDAAKDAADLSRRVANHLQNYNTDAVELELAEYRETAAKPDPELIKSYEALVNNLNRYRPHLPNWMINDDTTTEGVTETTDRSHVDPRTPRSARSTGSHNSHTDSSSVSEALSHGGHHHNHSPAGSAVQQLGGFPRMQAVTVAVVEFSSHAITSLRGRDRAVSNFVDHVHEWAAATSASLHSFVGDTVHVSWNATHNVIQPEAKAARFMTRVVAANKDDTGVAATGAATSGKAACQFSGSGRVQALTISLPWQRTQRQVIAFAAHHNTVVMDAATAKHATFAVESRAVDVVGIPDDQGKAEVHEVVSERKVEHGEWMYVLEKESPNDVVTAALRLAVDGRCGEAIEALETLGEDMVQAPMVARLRDRLDEAVMSSDSCLRAWVK